MRNYNSVITAPVVCRRGIYTALQIILMDCYIYVTLANRLRVVNNDIDALLSNTDLYKFYKSCMRGEVQ